jgi:hypothetical protein
MEQIDWIKEKEEEEELAEWLEKNIKPLGADLGKDWWKREYFAKKMEDLFDRFSEKRTFSRMLKKHGSK